MSGGGSGGQSESKQPGKQDSQYSAINEGSFHMEKLRQEATDTGFDSHGGAGCLAPVDMGHLQLGKPSKDTTTSATVTGEGDRGKPVSDAFAPPSGSLFKSPTSAQQEEGRAIGGREGGFVHSGEGIKSEDKKEDGVQLHLNTHLRNLPGGLAQGDKTGHHADGR